VITHSDISERLKAMKAEADTFRARQRKGHASLQEMCGGIGHEFGPVTRRIRVDLTAEFGIHVCKVCGHEAKV
jgi:hypothetical protein